MAITVNPLVANGTGTDATFFDTASIAPAASRLVVACLTLSDAAEPVLNSVSGNGLTWQVIDSLYWKTANAESDSSRSKTILIAADSGASPAPGAVRFDFAAQSMNRGVWSIFELSGTDLPNAGTLAELFVQVVKSSVDASATSLSLTLATAGNSNNRPFMVTGIRLNEAITHRTNWTEIGDFGLTDGAEASAQETEWRSDTFETTASSSWTTSCRRGGMAFEVKAEVAGGAATVTPGVIAAVTALPSMGLSAGSTVSPNSIAVTAAVTSVEGIDVGAGPDVIPVTVSVPQVTVSDTINATASPDVVAATVAIPQVSPSTSFAVEPAVIASVVALPTSAIVIPAKRWIFMVGEIGNDWSFTKGTIGESRRLWEHFGEQPRGKTVIRTSGTWATHAYPSQTDFDAADLIRFPDGTVDRAVLLGGHESPITADTAAELIDQGFGQFIVGVEEAA